MNRAATRATHLPVIDAESAPFWAGTRERKFLLRHCNACRQNHFYPRHHCPHCWSDNCEWRAASGHGRVYSYTVIHHNDALPFRERLPYIVALVDLEEGVRVTSNIVECTPEIIHVGMPVEVIYEQVTEEITLPQFRPRT
jgi:uncharacterized OB-fold protein